MCDTKAVSGVGVLDWLKRALNMSSNFNPKRGSARPCRVSLPTPGRALADARWPCSAQRIAQPLPPHRMAFPTMQFKIEGILPRGSSDILSAGTVDTTPVVLLRPKGVSEPCHQGTGNSPRL